MRRTLIFFTFIFGTYLLHAQETEFRFRMDQIFDNREYFTDLAHAQTIFAGRFDGTAVVEFDSAHSLGAGLNYMYEYGGKILGVSPQVNLYYSYNRGKLGFIMGSFPRRERVDMPLAFLTDTLDYYRPNLEGAYINFRNKNLDLKGFIDWTGRMSEERREAFLLGLDARFRYEGVFLNPSFLMYHNAHSSAGNERIQDNGIMSLLLGYERELDQGVSFSVSTGILASYDRTRPDAYAWGAGSFSNLEAGYTIFSAKAVYYYGSPVHFSYGDPFYAAGNYGRVDLYIDPFRRKDMDAKLGWNFHLVPGDGIYNSQQIIISLQF